MDTNSAIRKFVIDNFFVADAISLKDDTLLLENGIVDSTGVLEIIHFLEDAYHLKFEDEEILPDNLGSIARIAAVVERKLQLLPRPA